MATWHELRKIRTLEERKAGYSKAIETAGNITVSGLELLNSVYTAREAGQIWGVSVMAMQLACLGDTRYGANLPPKFAPCEARRSKGTWLVTEAGMRRVFGAPKGEKEND